MDRSNGPGPTQINRREVIRHASLIVGMGALVPELVSAAIAAASSGDAGPASLPDNRLKMLAAIVDQIIPQTDTPGASGAGVHNFIQVLMQDWLDQSNREMLMAGFVDLDCRAEELAGRNFLSCSNNEQQQIITHVDQQAFDAESSVREASSYFRLLKSLTLMGYYSSEVGATDELIFDPLPGDFENCVPYASIGRAWALGD